MWYFVPKKPISLIRTKEKKKTVIKNVLLLIKLFHILSIKIKSAIKRIYNTHTKLIIH